jgi:hypothetical protein
VLRLRAGVGPRQPASRAVVARRLDLPVARVRRAERRGLRVLRRSGRDGCGAVSDGTGADPGTAAAAAGGASLGAATVLAGDGSGGGGDRSSGSGGDGRDAAGGGSPDGSSGGGSAKNGGGASGGVQGVSATKPGPVSAATDVTLPLLALVLIGLTALGVRAARRSRAG